jgi:flagellar operon protein
MSAIASANNIGTKGLGNAKSVTGTPIDSIRNRESAGAEFKKSLADSIAEATSTQPGLAAHPAAVTKAALAQAATGQTTGQLSESLKFSAHAVDRMKSRGISFAPDVMKGIESAVSRAAAKGSKDTLVLAGDSALIVSVKNNTVVTVMDKFAMRENVFTNIDSTVVI